MKNNLSTTEVHEKEHFDKMSEAYDKNYNYDKPFTKYKINKKTLEASEIIKSEYGNKHISILDIGCGTGEYTLQLAKIFPNSHITGLDISSKIIETAKKKCKSFKNINFLVNSVYNTGIKPNSFDVITGFYVLHHLDIPKVDVEMQRIMKKGGVAVFYEPNILNPYVYLIKSNKKLKEMVGDSPDETAINPFRIKNEFTNLKLVRYETSEFLVPYEKIPLPLLIKLDNIVNYSKYLPLVKYFGGSIKILLRKV